MAAASKIAEFPSEMIAAIAAQADKTDLLPFRAVCRKWNAACDDIFLNTYFTKRTHLFWDYSLDALASISQVPRLAKAIKEIRIITQCSLLLQSPPECGIGSEMISSDMLQQTPNRHIERTGYGETGFADSDELIDHGRQSDFLQLRTVLQSVLSNIAKYTPTITFAVSSRASAAAYGRSKFLKLRVIETPYQRMRGDFGCSKYRMCNHDVAELALDAAARSSIVIERLDIGYSDLSYGLFPLHNPQLGHHSEITSNLRTPFSNLASVKLGVYAGCNSGPTIAKLLRTTIHLQELSIASLSSPECRIQSAHVQIAQYGASVWYIGTFNSHYRKAPFPVPKLKKLELRVMNVSVYLDRCGLLYFIHLFGETLRHLRLVRMFQGTRTGWASVCEGRSSLPVVEQVDLYGMDTEDSLGYSSLEYGITCEASFTSDGSVGMNGERDIATALKDFANVLRQPRILRRAPSPTPPAESDNKGMIDDEILEG